MKPLLFTLFSEGSLIQNISKKLSICVEPIVLREFPDGESYIKLAHDPKNRTCLLFDSLNYPNTKILPLLLLAATLRDLGANKIGLISPYLAYMRQDKRFQVGEAITSRYFAKLISEHFDWLITADPHLHRIQSLSEIYSIPTQAVHAIEAIGCWIKLNVAKPILIGPDMESKQWVESIANVVGVPFLILEKVRSGDYEVEVSLPAVDQYREYTPVLVDDIISTGKTMIETIKHLKKLRMQSICIGIHGIFAGDAYNDLLAAGASRIVTTNSITDKSNDIDLSKLIFEKVQIFL